MQFYLLIMHKVNIYSPYILQSQEWKTMEFDLFQQTIGDQTTRRIKPLLKRSF